MSAEAIRDATLSVIGLGHTGLPVAAAFIESGFRVTGFDLDSRRIEELRAGHDRTRPLSAEQLGCDTLLLTDQPGALADIDVHIVTVPTAVDTATRPDLTPLLRAAETVGQQMKPGTTVVFESTVYPGATEDVLVPVLERASGLVYNRDFYVGYSPERINPGDSAHDFSTLTKVVSGSTPETLEMLAALYGAVVTDGIHKAASIRIAEAAKVIENTQRNLNIALMNELSVMFHSLGIDTRDVLAAAGTSWNFLPFRPGLVSGHGVDPYCLGHLVPETGDTPQVMLAGRGVNEQMPRFVATSLIQACGRLGIAMPLTITVLGITCRVNVRDARNSAVAPLVHALEKDGARVQAIDPMADPAQTRAEHGIMLTPFEDAVPADAVVLAVPHWDFCGFTPEWAFIQGLLKDAKGFVSDLTGLLERETKPEAITLWRL